MAKEHAGVIGRDDKLPNYRYEIIEMFEPTFGQYCPNELDPLRLAQESFDCFGLAKGFETLSGASARS